MTAPGDTLRIWRTTVFMGTCMVALGVLAAYLEDLRRFPLYFVGDHFEVFMYAMLAGELGVCVGCIGWSNYLDRRHRLWMAGAVFGSPLAVLLVGYPFDGILYHGAAGIVISTMLPIAVILTVILLIMTAVRSQT